MPRGLSFTDAVTVLGGRSRLAEGLDRLTGGLLLAGSVGGSALVMSLFDPKNELSRVGGDLVAAGLDRARGLSRFDRSQRLEAAHAVIVVTAYFDAVAAVGLPFTLSEADISGQDQVAVAGGGHGAGHGAGRAGRRLSSVVEGLLRAQVPMPTPELPVEQAVDALAGYYRGLASDLVGFLSGLQGWDRLDETARARLEIRLRHDVPPTALARYEESFHRLATTMPEVAYWSNRVDHQATRQSVERVGVGFARLEVLLREMASGRRPDARREALAQLYRAALDQPILSSGEVPSGIRIPTLGEAYVGPDFRAGEASSAEDLVSESWWADRDLHGDLEAFLVGHFASLRATRAPLLVLGQPGSGKSVLTRVLAARLPAQDYLVIRVVLREVHADADLQAHIEYAIRATTGESVSWPDLARACGGALPVIILDGFDELLQATGTSQSDYLERVTDFQQREAALGRPVAMVVTTRTAVADRARCTPGTPAIRLEPFRRPQVERWLECWNATNAASFAERGLQPLPAQALMAHPELSTQPLLLMMLALYDADRNALQRLDGTLGRADLYERLLHRFAEREVSKDDRSMSEREYAQAVDRELLRLSVVAFAMFNRRRQWVSEGELDADLPALLPPPRSRTVPHVGLRAELAPSEQAVGRFFFVHRSSATRDGRQLRTFEFLHATFGEYLLGRLVAHELSDMAKVAHLNRDRSRLVPTDDAFLHAVLSYAPLTMRGTAVSFLRELIAHWPDDERQVLRDPLLRLLQHAMEPVQDRKYEQYAPTALGVPARHGTYACNLLVLLLIVGGEVTAAEIFEGKRDIQFHWRNLVLLWRSQLPVEGWCGLLELVRADRTRLKPSPSSSTAVPAPTRDIRLRLETDQTPVPSLDPNWFYDDLSVVRGTDGPVGWIFHQPEDLRRHINLTCERRIDVLAHVTDPFQDVLPEALVRFARGSDGIARSAANALVAVLLAGADLDEQQLCRLYEQCITIADLAFPPSAQRPREAYLRLVLRQLTLDADRLPTPWCTDYILRVRRLSPDVDIAESDTANVTIVLPDAEPITRPVAQPGGPPMPAPPGRTPRPRR